MITTSFINWIVFINYPGAHIMAYEDSEVIFITRTR